MGMLLSFFRGIYFKPCENLISINGNIKECQTRIERFSMVSALDVVLKSHDSLPCDPCESAKFELMALAN